MFSCFWMQGLPQEFAQNPSSRLTLHVYEQVWCVWKKFGKLCHVYWRFNLLNVYRMRCENMLWLLTLSVFPSLHVFSRRLTTAPLWLDRYAFRETRILLESSLKDSQILLTSGDHQERFHSLLLAAGKNYDKIIALVIPVIFSIRIYHLHSSYDSLEWDCKFHVFPILCYIISLAKNTTWNQTDLVRLHHPVLIHVRASLNNAKLSVRWYLKCSHSRITSVFINSLCFPHPSSWVVEG